ncbi:MAG: calcium-binding protein [Rhodospirillales bacterium]|nr:calcium-binding protein [Rhodospirillales bacterium]
MATYTGTSGNDSIDIPVAYANPGVVDAKAYGYGGNDSITVDYELSYDEETYSYQAGTYSGQVEIHGGAGNDSIGNGQYLHLYETNAPVIDDVVNRFYGEGGNDTLTSYLVTYKYDQQGQSVEYLHGGTGNDTYRIAQANDHVIEKAGEGTDTIRAMFASSFDNDTVVMPANVENVVLESDDWGCLFPSSLTVEGNDLNNRIVGNEIGNELKGGGGNDTLFGGLSDLFGEPVPDILRGGAGDDRIYGGRSDDDRADGPDSIYGDDGNDDVWAGGGDDEVWGGAGNDNLYGQSGNDTLRGGDGNERVYGGTGNDTLYGDDGVDAVRGGEGLDRLYGGSGNDRFDYDAIADSKPGSSTRDVIFDFEGIGGASGDRIDLATIDAKTGVSGNQAFAFIGTAAFTGAGQVRVTDAGADTLIQANTGGSLSPELEIAAQDAGVQPGQWVAGDFIL